MRRHWLRPRWYVAESDRLRLETPWEWQGYITGPLDPSDWTCVNCGRPCLGGEDDPAHGGEDLGGYSDPEGFHCEACHDVLHPPARGIARLVRDFHIRVDNFYCRYAQRFGKRVQRPEGKR